MTSTKRPLSALLLTFALLAGVVTTASPAHAATTRMLGVSISGGYDGVKKYESWLGRKLNLVNVYLPQSSWGDMVASAKSVAGNWSGKGYRVVVSVPMLLKDSGSLKNGANGQYDTYFKQIAQNLKNGGLGNAIIRLGWEFDGAWFQWNAFKDPASFKAFWQRTVKNMRNISGSFKFDWTSNINGGKSVDSLYPGDSFVDIIGMDVYDQSYGQSQKLPSDRWQTMLTGTNGLQWHRDFAKKHGKPMSYSEWGLWTEHIDGATPDNALFIKNMYSWIKSNNVLYSAYFEYKTHNGQHNLMPTTKFPNGAKAYKTNFSTGLGSYG